MSETKRTYKDSLFSVVFGENKENALDLYNAINNTDYTNTDDLIITTLKDVVYIGFKNDVAFLFGDVMNLYEHQSTFNPNMPFRGGLEYFPALYKRYLEELPGGLQRLYGDSLVRIPTPKYYVFYNGTKDQPETLDLHLSDAYQGEGDIEVIAHMININQGKSAVLMSRCKPLREYAEFIHRVRLNRANGLTRDEAVSGAIDSCIRDDVLTAILREERAKVEDIMYRAWTDEEIEWLREYNRQNDIKQGIELGEDRLAKLVECLISDGRNHDVEAITKDKDYRNKLYAEYGIEHNTTDK